MPTYEYACKSCGEHLEKVQSFTDDALTTCPACGGPLRKVFGNIGISFKGSGFYKNDSRSASSSTTPAAHSKDSAGGDSSSSSAGSSSEGSGSKADSPAKGPKEAGPKESKDSGSSKQPASSATKAAS
jgi:putative FmdB family regulatory protein